MRCAYGVGLWVTGVIVLGDVEAPRLEQVAGLLVHHAARTDTSRASRLLACTLKVTRQDDQALRVLRSELGRPAAELTGPAAH